MNLAAPSRKSSPVKVLRVFKLRSFHYLRHDTSL